MIPDPRTLTVADWCDSMALVLQKVMVPPILLSPIAWTDWARTVVQAPGVARFNPPNPDTFTDWAEWAMRFKQVVQL